MAERAINFPMLNRYFIAVYTNQVKDYCDEVFFSNLYKVSRGEPVYVIDNTSGDGYTRKLNNMFAQNGYSNFTTHHLDVPEHPRESLFQRNVCSSVNYLRNIFLDKTELPYFLIVESDIYSPPDLLDKFESSIASLNQVQPGWGIVGGLYYQGFHDYNLNVTNTTLQRTAHCLSGCTVYKRELITKYPFRYDPSDLRNFPDALISFDSSKEYTLWNEHRIKCDHLHNPANGARVSCEKKMDVPLLMPYQMEAFNGDIFIEEEFLKLRDRFNIEIIIETGTCFGSTTKFLGNNFKQVVSIEINRQYLDIARALIGAVPNIDTYCGASEKILPEIIQADWKNKTVMFFLDAHWEAHCPLHDELRIIAEHKLKPVIAIHDFQVPGEGLSFDSYHGQPFTFEWLKPIFDRIYGENGYDHYYNSVATATEIKVGIIYIIPRAES